MTSQLNEFSLKSEYHTAASEAEVPGLVDQMTSDLRAGHGFIVNGAPPKGGGHFRSVTGLTTGPQRRDSCIWSTFQPPSRRELGQRIASTSMHPGTADDIS